MPTNKIRREMSVPDRRTALTLAVSGVALALMGVAFLIAASVRAGEAQGSEVMETIIFGTAATLFGAYLFRAGIRATRRIRTVRSDTAIDEGETPAGDLNKAA